MSGGGEGGGGGGGTLWVMSEEELQKVCNYLVNVKECNVHRILFNCLIMS